MKDLDDIQAIKNLDLGNIIGSIDQLPNQCLHAWEDTENIEVPDSYRSINNIVMAGMGGSGLGARIIESLYAEELMYPLTRVNDYHLPGFVDEDTLVINSSYSGNTEEILNTAEVSQKKQAKWMAITTGGKLLEFAREHDVPVYVIDPENNPSGQPRMAIGYSVIGQLALVNKIGLIRIDKKDILVAVEAMSEVQKGSALQIDLEHNPAKKMAKKLYGKDIFFVSSHHLSGAVHTVNNQLNESAKIFSSDFVVPELNHHLMEGLKNPPGNKENLIFFFVDSDLYTDRISKRMNITKEVVNKNNIETAYYKPKSPTALGQVFEFIQFGAYVNFYLAILYGQDPSPVPWVDYFKEELKKD